MATAFATGHRRIGVSRDDEVRVIRRKRLNPRRKSMRAGSGTRHASPSVQPTQPQRLVNRPLRESPCSITPSSSSSSR
jgi:hypothetical protein